MVNLPYSLPKTVVTLFSTLELTYVSGYSQVSNFVDNVNAYPTIAPPAVVPLHVTPWLDP